MKHIFIYSLLLICLFASCNSSNSPGTENVSNIEKTITRPFSDSLKSDTFKVKLDVNSSKETKLIFTITSFEGNLVYEEAIKADDLFKNYDATIDLKKKKNQAKFLNEELDRFFDEENFMEPAIMENEVPDQYVPDKGFYEELKKSQLNGFIYRLGKENKMYIGWSAKDKKVKTYYNCCKITSQAKK
ncbi:hypothetical protein [Pedobacter frigoris]|uniref:Lipoprotein n=1 Tax=Pedobacter frigoris TaxID=2571272 RepID=A0A4U1CFY3_9SPHI|nr:hypothetical protein [Pedobacter frigoris]TKC06028.1 hypothetical protein FA047_11880 [Pedobacter frigoris]